MVKRFGWRLAAGGLRLVLCLLSTAALAREKKPELAAAEWPGERMPLPLAVKSPEDLAFKALAERHYLIFNLLAGGKVAFDKGDYAGAAEKWEALLRLENLDPQIDKELR